MKTFKGWHFIRENKRLRFGDGRTVKVGKSVHVSCDPMVGRKGLHGCRRIIDALSFAAGPVLCQVELSGKIDIKKHRNNLPIKASSTDRECQKMVDLSKGLHEFGIWIAEKAIRRLEESGVNIDNFRKVIDKKKEIMSDDDKLRAFGRDDIGSFPYYSGTSERATYLSNAIYHGLCVGRRNWNAAYLASDYLSTSFVDSGREVRRHDRKLRKLFAKYV